MTAPRAAACPAAAASPGRLAAAAWDRVPISATTRNTSLTRLSWGVGVIENQSEDGCIQSQEETVEPQARVLTHEGSYRSLFSRVLRNQAAPALEKCSDAGEMHWDR